MARTPDGPPPPPVVQRIRIRYAKRGRLRFTSHRDIARAFERALRRAAVPMAFSAGFSPHPKVSWVGAAPTGVASEAEYVEIGLAEVADPRAVADAVDAALPDGLDVVEAVEAAGEPLPARIEASRWRIELPGVATAELEAALARFLAADEVQVQRLTKNGRREVDARAAVDTASVAAAPDDSPASLCAILETVVRHVTPAVRPDDVLSGLRSAAGLEPPVPPRATRLAQGRLTERGEVDDPFAADRDGSVTGAAT